MLNIMVLLYPFRVTKVGQNQMQSVCMPFLTQNPLDML